MLLAFGLRRTGNTAAKHVPYYSTSKCQSPQQQTRRHALNKDPVCRGAHKRHMEACELVRGVGDGSWWWCPCSGANQKQPNQEKQKKHPGQSTRHNQKNAKTPPDRPSSAPSALARSTGTPGTVSGTGARCPPPPAFGQAHPPATAVDATHTETEQKRREGF